MAVEEIEKLVDVPFNFVSRKIKKTIYITSDGTEFEKYSVATKYERKYLLTKEFKEYFSEEKNNFIIGTEELNNGLWLDDAGEDEYYDFFWVKVNNEQEKEFLENFCKKFYKLGYSNLFLKGNCSDIGWIYVLIIKDNEAFWVSRKQMESNIQAIQNNFPENIKTKNTVINKKITRAELIDI